MRRRRKLQEVHLERSFTQSPVQLNELAMVVRKVEEECKRKEKALKEAEESMKMNDNTISTLRIRERDATHKIVCCRNKAIEVLQAINTDKSKDHIDKALEKKKLRDKSTKQQRSVGIKRVGSIDERPWMTEFQRRYEDEDDWPQKMLYELPWWELLLRDPKFSPFKLFQIGEDKWESEIDHQHLRLLLLKEDFGQEVYNSVTTALKEIEDYNASGRYPVPLPWNYEESRMATLEEVMAYLGLIVEAFVETNPPAKKPRGCRDFVPSSKADFHPA